MRIYVNEKSLDIAENTTAFSVRDLIKKDADIILLNGGVLCENEDVLLKENDKLTLIQKGEVPKKEELEAILIARHTLTVHKRIKKASVGIAGLGGLGSNAAISLARIGIGKLLLVDFDVVEPSNLNRQQYFIRHIGMPKTEALKELLKEINPFVQVETKNVYLDKGNIEDCFRNVDIIVEAFDDPKSKATLANIILTRFPDKFIVGASGIAGYFSSNTIKTKKIRKGFYMVGDGISESKSGCGLMAPRVAIAANHQANMVLRIILEKEDTE